MSNFPPKARAYGDETSDLSLVRKTVEAGDRTCYSAEVGKVITLCACEAYTENSICTKK